MVDNPLTIFQDFVEKLFRETKEIRNIVLFRQAEKRLLIFYSLGFLSDNYSEAAEEAMKKKADYEATFFSAKASEIRQACDDIFDEFPDKEYYRELEYKVPKWASVKTPPEKIQEIAAFCATNLALDPDVVSNSRALFNDVKTRLRKARVTGIDGKYVSVMKKRFKALKDKPAKMGTLYEMVLLLENINQIIKVMKEEAKKAKGR